MDYSQNVNYSCSTELIHSSSSSDSSNPSVLREDLKQLRIKRHTLEDQKAKHECLKSENNDLMNQVENLENAVKDAVQRNHELFDNSNRDLADKKSKQELLTTIQSTIVKLENENKELKCFLFSQKSELEIACNNRERLQHIYVKSEEYNEELRKILAMKEDKALESERKRVQLADEISGKSSAVAKCRGDLSAAEKAVQTESERLAGLQRRNVACEQTSKRLAARFADVQAELAAFEAEAAEWTAGAERSVRAAAEETAGAQAELSRAADSRRRAADALSELKADVEAEERRGQAALRELCQENDRLTGRLSDESARQVAVLADNRRLADCARADAERLAGATAQINRLERRMDHERALLATRRAMCDGETAMLDYVNKAVRYRSEMARDEIDAIKCQLSDCRAAAGTSRSSLQGETTCDAVSTWS